MVDLLTVENGIALLTLTALEIVLGIDNIVFLAIVVGKLPDEQRGKARRIGLVLAMGMCIVLLHYDQLDSRYKGLLPLKRIFIPEALDEDAN